MEPWDSVVERERPPAPSGFSAGSPTPGMARVMWGGGFSGSALRFMIGRVDVEGRLDGGDWRPVGFLMNSGGAVSIPLAAGSWEVRLCAVRYDGIIGEPSNTVSITVEPCACECACECGDGGDGDDGDDGGLTGDVYIIRDNNEGWSPSPNTNEIAILDGHPQIDEYDYPIDVEVQLAVVSQAEIDMDQYYEWEVQILFPDNRDAYDSSWETSLDGGITWSTNWSAASYTLRVPLPHTSESRFDSDGIYSQDILIRPVEGVVDPTIPLTAQVNNGVGSSLRIKDRDGNVTARSTQGYSGSSDYDEYAWKYEFHDPRIRLDYGLSVNGVSSDSLTLGVDESGYHVTFQVKATDLGRRNLLSILDSHPGGSSSSDVFVLHEPHTDWVKQTYRVDSGSAGRWLRPGDIYPSFRGEHGATVLLFFRFFDTGGDDSPIDMLDQNIDRSGHTQIPIWSPSQYAEAHGTRENVVEPGEYGLAAPEGLESSFLADP